MYAAIALHVLWNSSTFHKKQISLHSPPSSACFLPFIGKRSLFLTEFTCLSNYPAPSPHQPEGSVLSLSCVHTKLQQQWGLWSPSTLGKGWCSHFYRFGTWIVDAYVGMVEVSWGLCTRSVGRGLPVKQELKNELAPRFATPFWKGMCSNPGPCAGEGSKTCIILWEEEEQGCRKQVLALFGQCCWDGKPCLLRPVMVCCPTGLLLWG